MKHIYVDIDGTLSAPRYYDGDKFVIGFDEEGWTNHCKKNLEKAYDDCLVLTPVIDYLKSLNNVQCFVLSGVSSKEEEIAKRAFIQKNCPDLFEDILFVSSQKEKIKVILSKSTDSTLIDDNFDILLEAHNNGIQAIHISNIITRTISQ